MVVQVSSLHYKLEQLLMTDRQIEKAFRKEFQDSNEAFAVLQTLSKERAQQDGIAEDSLDPFPAGACRYDGQLVAEMLRVERPETCDLIVWQKFLRWYQSKTATENDIARTRLEYNELKSLMDYVGNEVDVYGIANLSCLNFGSFRTSEIEFPEIMHIMWLAMECRVTKEIQRIAQNLQDLQQQVKCETLDLPISLMLKNGAIETQYETVESCNRHHAVLLHAKHVHGVNSVVRERSLACIRILEEIRDFKVGIFKLLFDCKKLDMEREDASNKVRELQLLRVSHEVRKSNSAVEFALARRLPQMNVCSFFPIRPRQQRNQRSRSSSWKHKCSIMPFSMQSLSENASDIFNR
jgi:hypothetical protein